MTAKTATRTAIRLRERRDTLPREVARKILVLAQARMGTYDRKVEEAVRAILDRFPEAEIDETLWPAIKLAYVALLREHDRPERAEAFYDSVARAVLHPRHHHDEFIFSG